MVGLSANIAVELLPEPWTPAALKALDCRKVTKTEDPIRPFCALGNTSQNSLETFLVSSYPYAKYPVQPSENGDTYVKEKAVTAPSRAHFFSRHSILDVMSGEPMARLLARKVARGLPWVFAVSELIADERKGALFFDGARLTKTFVDDPGLLARNASYSSTSSLTLKTDKESIAAKDPIFFSLLGRDRRVHRIGSLSSVMTGPNDYLFSVLAIQNFDGYDRASQDSTYSTLGALVFAGEMVEKDEALAHAIIARIPSSGRECALSESLIESVVSDNIAMVRALVVLGASAEYKAPDDDLSALDLASGDGRNTILRLLVDNSESAVKPSGPESKKPVSLPGLQN